MIDCFDLQISYLAPNVRQTLGIALRLPQKTFKQYDNDKIERIGIH